MHLACQVTSNLENPVLQHSVRIGFNETLFDKVSLLFVQLLYPAYDVVFEVEFIELKRGHQIGQIFRNGNKYCHEDLKDEASDNNALELTDLLGAYPNFILLVLELAPALNVLIPPNALRVIQGSYEVFLKNASWWLEPIVIAIILQKVTPARNQYLNVVP